MHPLPTTFHQLPLLTSVLRWKVFCPHLQTRNAWNHWMYLEGKTLRKRLRQLYGKAICAKPFNSTIQIYMKFMYYDRISIIVMMFADDGGGGYYFFRHCTWDGLYVADLAFPWWAEFILWISYMMIFLWMLGLCLMYQKLKKLIST